MAKAQGLDTRETPELQDGEALSAQRMKGMNDFG
jgi:hypothetical protein